MSVSENCTRPRLLLPPARRRSRRRRPPPPRPPKPPPRPPPATVAAGWRSGSPPRRRAWGRSACAPAWSCRLGRARRGRRSRTAARSWSMTACEGRCDFSGLVKSKPIRSCVAARAVEIDRAQGRPTETQLCRRGSTASRTNRSGKAASICGVTRDVGDRVCRSSDAHNRRGAGDRSSANGCQLALSLITLRRSRLKVRIAAGDRGDQHRLAGREVENPRCWACRAPDRRAG